MALERSSRYLRRDNVFSQAVVKIWHLDVPSPAIPQCHRLFRRSVLTTQQASLQGVSAQTITTFHAIDFSAVRQTVKSASTVPKCPMLASSQVAYACGQNLQVWSTTHHTRIVCTSPAFTTQNIYATQRSLCHHQRHLPHTCDMHAIVSTETGPTPSMLYQLSCNDIELMQCCVRLVCV